MIDRPEAGELQRGFDLRETVSFTWRHWKFIAGVTGVVFLVGTINLLQQVPVYTATSQILLEQPRQRTPGGEAVVQDDNLDDAMLQGQMAIIGSTVLLRRVVEREHLTSDPAFAEHVPQRPSIPFLEIATSFVSSVPLLLHILDASRAAPTPISVLAQSDSDRIPNDEMRIIEALKSSMKVSRVTTDGFVVAISVTSPDPVQAARLANAIANGYLVDKLDSRFEVARRASVWLSDRLVGLRNQLHDSEEAVARFRAEHGLIQSGNVTLNQQQLSDLNGQLISARADLAQKRAQVDQLNAIQAKGGSLQNMPAVTNAGALPTLRAQQTALSANEADLRAHYASNHPLIVNIEAQLRDVNRSIGAETQRLAASLRNDYALAQARVLSLERSLRQVTGQTNLDEATAVRLRELERSAEVNKILFENFLKDAKITQAQATFEPQDARVITPALPPGAPSYPNKTRSMAINLMIGLLLGVGGAVAKEKLNVGFMTPKQVEDQTGLPVLTSVSQLTARELKIDGVWFRIFDYSTAKPLTRFSESIRALRSGILMTDVDHPPKVIQVTSALPLEGKTTIALSLAASAAMGKLKTLFIDADLRHPGATRELGQQKEAGLVDLLSGEVTAEEVIKLRENERYWVLGAGHKTQSPTDLLGSERMRQLVAELKGVYDFVVIDTPPVAPVVDPTVVSQIVDKVVFVVRWGSTPRELVGRCVSQLSGHRKIAGVAFNRVDEKQAKKYGKDAYSYYYGSRYYKDYYTH